MKINWLGLATGVLGVAGMVVGALQEKQNDKKMAELVEKKVAEALKNK